jgi:hypothetical protein
VQRALQKVHKEIVIFFYETFLLFYVVCTSWHATNTHISLSIVKRKETERERERDAWVHNTKLPCSLPWFTFISFYVDSSNNTRHLECATVRNRL